MKYVPMTRAMAVADEVADALSVRHEITSADRMLIASKFRKHADHEVAMALLRLSGDDHE